MAMDDSEHHGGTILNVVVPRESGPGQQLIVVTPGDKRRVAAIVPAGYRAGSTFQIRVPSHPSSLSISSSSMNSSNNNGSQQTRKQNQQQSQQQKQNQSASSSSPSPSPSSSSSILKIKVPKGKTRKGDKFKVRLDNGRIIEATVPTNNITEFYLDVGQQRKKKQQNWHDNPFAVLPMTVGPFFSWQHVR